jgi:hypothetical protein
MATKRAAAMKRVPAKKAPVKKTAVKKTAVKKAAVRQAPVRKSSATKAPAAKTSVRRATTKAPGSRKARTVVGNVVTPMAWGPAQRTDELAVHLGGVTALARALGVSPSQPSRWKSGKESPGPDMARRLVDLDHVVARALLVWDPEVIPDWLASPNGHLGGATPLGVLATQGPSSVLDALDAVEAGGFA